MARVLGMATPIQRLVFAYDSIHSGLPPFLTSCDIQQFEPVTLYFSEALSHHEKQAPQWTSAPKQVRIVQQPNQQGGYHFQRGSKIPSMMPVPIGHRSCGTALKCSKSSDHSFSTGSSQANHPVRTKQSAFYHRGIWIRMALIGSHV